ncbi:MAG: fumarylacetoacetate hydrolase family protein [Deltaproteobacteria bacterium]|nr:fumarylacetoacetate hydrolase family protein [Deltaproteobacteria bacterium]
MKIAAFRTSGDTLRRVGKVSENFIEDITESFPTIADAMTARRSELETAKGPRVDLSDARLLAPIDPCATILCVAANYHSHIKEANLPAIRPHPLIFFKPQTSVVGPGDDVLLPSISQAVDYEAELAVVIGRKGYAVPAQNAMGLVAGYTILNDISARDLQITLFRDKRDYDWFSGKGLDTSAPAGPWVSTPEEMPYENNIRIQLWLNDKLMQNETTADMVFSIPQIIEYITHRMTLRPGDIIATGTPAGVGKFQGIYLKPGDTIVIEIEGIGRLENQVAAHPGRLNK